MRSENRLLQSIEEQRAVRQVGQRIVIGEIRDALVGEVALAAHRRFAQLARDRGRQPPEVGLHDVVVRAGLHGGDGVVFADRGGHENERQVRMLLADDRERLLAAEPRHRVVRDHEVPAGFVELAAQRRGTVDPPRHDVVTGARQRQLNQSRVVIGVLNLQKP